MSMKLPNVTRRELFLNAVKAAVFAPVAFAALSGRFVAQAAETLKLVPADNPVAKALKYSATKKDGCKDKSGIKCDAQTCGNCQLYTDAGKVDGKDGGKCAMIPGFAVEKKGWCSSWSKKA